MVFTRWVEWSEAIMRMIIDVKPGEKLLILADTWTDLDAAEACFLAGITSKSLSQLLIIPKLHRTDPREFGPAMKAIMGADAIVDLSESMENINLNSAALKARENGTRIASCSIRTAGDWAIVGILNVDYPLMLKAAERISELWQRTEICRVTSSAGTDISFKLKGRPCDLGDGRAIRPGELDYFPGVTPSIAPIEETVNGTIVVDGTISDPYMPVADPVVLRLEKGVITSIEGGQAANALRSYLESGGEREAFHMAHFNIGINPAAKFGVHMGQDEMVLGAVTFGFGYQDPGFKGAVGPCTIHADVTLRSPTIYLDGAVMCKDNRLNQDLGLSTGL